MKNVAPILSIIVAFVLTFAFSAHDKLFYILLSGAISGILVYVACLRKLDFDDSLIYILMGFFILFGFGLNSLNVMIYLGVYMLGSIPFGLILAQIFAKVDIKSEGSKSIGATNVLRVIKKDNPSLAKKLAVATLVLDFLKACLPLLVAKLMGFDANMLYSIGVLAVLGHCFSAYLRFEGGKGVATGAGVMAVLLPLELIIALVAWFIMAKIVKVSSLASLVGLVVFLAASFILHPEIERLNTHAPILIICFIIVYKHIPNIKRMFKKEECKVI